MHSTPLTPSQTIAITKQGDWGVEPADDGAWIARSPRQDLFALPAEMLTIAAPLMADGAATIDAVVAQLAQILGALRLDPVPVACPPCPALPAPLRFGHHRSARSVDAPLHIWRPTPRGRSKQRHVTLCGTVMTEAPGTVNLASLHLRLCRNCARVLSAIHTGAVQTPDPAKPAALERWVWERNTRTIGAIGYWRLCNRATEYATSDVPNPQDAVARALTKLRQLLRQALHAGLQDTERAAGVLRAYGWPVEQRDGTWQP